MYFIQEGIVDIVSNGEIATSLSDGSYFGGTYRNDPYDRIPILTNDSLGKNKINDLARCALPIQDCKLSFYQSVSTREPL